MSSPSRTGRFLNLSFTQAVNLSFTQDTQHLIHALPPHATQQRPFCSSSVLSVMEFTQRGLAKVLWSSRPPLREYTAPSRFLFSANPHTRRGLLSAPPHHRRSSSLCPTARDQTPHVPTSPQSNAANMGFHLTAIERCKSSRGSQLAPPSKPTVSSPSTSPITPKTCGSLPVSRSKGTARSICKIPKLKCSTAPSARSSDLNAC